MTEPNINLELSDY